MMRQGLMFHTEQSNIVVPAPIRDRVGFTDECKVAFSSTTTKRHIYYLKNH